MNTQPGSAARPRHGLWNRWPVTTTATLGGLTALAVLLAGNACTSELPVAREIAAADEAEPDDSQAPAGDRSQVHRGEEGRMGAPTPVGPRDAVAEDAARSAGILGLMAADKGSFLASPHGGAFAVGSDDADVWGGLTGTEIGEAYGVGGLGLVGTGRGGGGTGEGTIGLGSVGTAGKGSGSGYGRGAGFGGRGDGGGASTFGRDGGRFDGALRPGTLTVGCVDDNADAKGWRTALRRLDADRKALGIDAALWSKSAPKQRHAERPGNLDIALVIDTTGSMGDELEYLKVELRHIAERIDREFPGVAQRWALVVYRDRGDDYVTRRFDFQGIGEFVERLGQQQATGGGDTPEAMHAALAASEQLAWRSGEDTARMIFLVADAPTHTGDEAREFAASVVNHRAAGTAIYPIAGSGVRSQAEAELRLAARATGGQYIFLTDHSGVGGSHAKPKVDQFTVESLHDAMARMIRGELGNPTPAAPPVAEPEPAPVVAAAPVPLPAAEAPAPIVIAIPVVASASPGLWDEFKARAAAHLLLAGSLSLVLLAAMSVDTWLRRRRRR